MTAIRQITVLIAFLPGAVLLAAGGESLDISAVQHSRWRIVLTDGQPAPSTIKLSRKWIGRLCRTRVVNSSKTRVRIKEVLLFSLSHQLPPETGLYGEGFTKLSITAGTLGKPRPLTPYQDAKHYRIPQPAGAAAYYGLLMLSPPRADRILMAFTSCRRFIGKFYVRPQSVEVVVDTEGLELASGETWELEEFLFTNGQQREALLSELAARAVSNHPPLLSKRIPTGWCSWYMLKGENEIIGPDVTSVDVLRNLDFMSRELPQLRYVQIDEGYEVAEGDWLETGKGFGGNIQEVLAQVRARGFEPAIWVGPFIAEEKSLVFREHPDWFIRDDNGKPLRSDRVTFGGWYHGPWYALDGTNPSAQEHLENVFRTMRQQWGCTYFKLDANFWGAMHGGHFYDPKATRIEAYRRGMQAVLRGAGDAFILGCNHPLWPSLGLIRGSRSSDDVGNRSWETFSSVARESLLRNWQSGRFWWNDPDCVLLTGNLPEEVFRFHATVIYATGGLVLSGDDLPKIPPQRLAILRKLLPPTGVAARFDDESLKIGRVKLADRTMICLFNWDEQPQPVSVRLNHPSNLTDYWTGQDLGTYENVFEIRSMPPRSARLLVAK